MTTANRDRSHESIINDALARLLRERCGLNAVAETLHGGKRPDIVVRLSDWTVILETELEPARTVEADALSRLRMEIGGSKIQNVFAVTVPGQLREANQQFLLDRMAVATLTWQEWRSDGTSGPKISGTPIEFGNAVQRTSPPAGDLDKAVRVLDDGARRAGAQLYSSPGTLGRVAKVFGADASDEAANMAALVIINAMTFQNRLASREAAFQPITAALGDQGFSRIRLLQIWDYILDIDYYPIFSMARDVVRELSDVEAAAVLGECASSPSEKHDRRVVGGIIGAVQ